ncbi:MAG: hypothetical protein IJU86_00935 [Firmicutes bacterium]|nr:hypothetical protein [Bacillota bacterium]
MKKILSLMLLTFCLSFVINFFDESKASAENYVSVGEYSGRHWYLNTDSVYIEKRNPLCFSCIMFGKSNFDSMYDFSVDFEFKTQNDGTVYVTGKAFTGEDSWTMTNEDIHLINAYQYVLYNY